MTLSAANHRIFLALVIGTALSGCGDPDGELRGAVSKSADGGTYFGVADNDGGGCGPIQVDGKPWPYAIGKVAPIAPGQHTIKICSGMQFDVAAGTTFLFDYWGP